MTVDAGTAQDAALKDLLDKAEHLYRDYRLEARTSSVVYHRVSPSEGTVPDTSSI